MVIWQWNSITTAILLQFLQVQVFAGTGNWEQIYSRREQLKQNYLEGGRPATCRRLTAKAEGGGFSYLIIHCCYITIHKKGMEWKKRAQRETPNIFYVKKEKKKSCSYFNTLCLLICFCVFYELSTSFSSIFFSTGTSDDMCFYSLFITYQPSSSITLI